MFEGGAVVKTDGGVEAARAAYAAWLAGIAGAPYEDNHSMNLEDIPGHVARMTFREGWYRWTPCNPRSCFDGMQHRPGHLGYATGPGLGVWRGVTVDYP
jgi:hypothetical protein